MNGWGSSVNKGFWMHFTIYFSRHVFAEKKQNRSSTFQQVDVVAVCSLPLSCRWNQGSFQATSVQLHGPAPQYKRGSKQNTVTFQSVSIDHWCVIARCDSHLWVAFHDAAVLRHGRGAKNKSESISTHLCCVIVCPLTAFTAQQRTQCAKVWSSGYLKSH